MNKRDANQVKWDKRFLAVTEIVSSWSSCLRRRVGCVITQKGRIIATGYNGAPAGLLSCVERGYCLRERARSGDELSNCYATHAEQNALLQAARLGISIDGSTMYCTTKPCSLCTKLIINAGIKRLVYVFDYPDEFADELLAQSKIEVVKYDN